MMTNHPNKKALEELLQQGLEAQAQGESVDALLAQHPQEAADLEPLLSFAVQLEDSWKVTPTSGARAAARYQVLARASQRPRGLLAAFGLLPQRPRPLVVGMVTVLLLALGSTGAVSASANALPGDSLYPVKTGWEQIQISLTFDEGAKARAYAALAERRTEEVAELKSQGKPVSPEGVAALTSQTLAAITALGKEPDPSVSLGEKMLEITQRQQQVLEEVAAAAPAAAQPALQHALEASRSGHQRAQEALDRAKEQKQKAEAEKALKEEREKGKAKDKGDNKDREQDNSGRGPGAPENRGQGGDQRKATPTAGATALPASPAATPTATAIVTPTSTPTRGRTPTPTATARPSASTNSGKPEASDERHDKGKEEHEQKDAEKSNRNMLEDEKPAMRPALSRGRPTS